MVEISNSAEEDVNKKIAQAQEAKRKRRAKIEQIQETIAFIIIVCIFAGGAGYLFYLFYDRSHRDLEYLTKLNETTTQMSQIIDSIRQVQTIYDDEEVITTDRLIQLGVIPESILQSHGDGRKIINPFGGEVLIQSSKPLRSKDWLVESPTFKLSYQGLSHRACVALATMDWGDTIKGLMAIAVGDYNPYEKVDTAFRDIDFDAEDERKAEEEQQRKDKKGFRRNWRPRMRYIMNVAKPGDENMPTPFSKEAADVACSCYNRDTCSFAVLYSVFAVK